MNRLPRPSEAALRRAEAATSGDRRPGDLAAQRPPLQLVVPGRIVPPVAGLARTTCLSRARALLPSYSAVTAPWKTMLIAARRHSVSRRVADRQSTEHQSGPPLCQPAGVRTA